MPKEVPHSAEYVTRKRRHRIWLRVVGSLACLVVFCTTYALILPAITMEETAYCGVEEHQHSAECYTQKLICQLSEEETGGHVHAEECYQTEWVLICTQEESQGHTHTEECQQVEDLLVCDLPEDEDHTHDESCYTQQVTYICGLEESEGHTHTEECYEEVRELICDQEESEPQAHVHDESCYEEVLTCEQEEHTHSLICYSDPTADVETAAVWEKTLPETLSGDWSEDLLAVAQSQLGYTESSRNYTVTEDGEKKGYTRYGDWYGDPYGDWCAMFVSFCLNYAEIPQEVIPYEASCQRWIEALEKEEYDLYRKAEDYIPVPGDLIFFNWDEEPDSDHVGIVTEVVLDAEDVPTQIKTIEGNSADQVQSGTYNAGDSSIMGYAQLTEPSQAELGISLLAEEEASNVFTFQDSEGMSITLTLDGSNYTTADYYLQVDRQNQENYTNALNSFTAHGEVVEEAVIYKIYLIQKDNSQTITSLNCNYTLEMSWANGLFECVDSSDFLNFTYCKNPGSEPTALNNCQVTYSADGNVTALEASDYFPNSAEFMFVRSSAPNGLTAGRYHLSYNEVKDAFLSDSAYSKYYNSNSPIGTAGSFHIVAFDTANLNAHTNGNVLAKNLNAGANFGTSNFADELSYVQNYLRVNGNSASSENHVLVIGSENTVEFVDNGNAFAINGTKIDKPNNLIQDKDTATAPFIDLNRVKTEISQISQNLNGYEAANLTYTSASDLSADHSKLQLTTPSGVGVANYTASELSEKLGKYVQIDGFKTGSNGTVVINVDCTGVKVIDMPQARIVIDGEVQGTNEVTEFSAGKVIWNFVNAGDVTINTLQMTGIIVAPGATVNINQNLNGTVVADVVNVNAESHRTDFTGTVTEPDETPEVDEYYVTVQKIETGYAGTALPGAEFDLYSWDSNNWVKVNTETLKTGDSGTVMLRNLDASVAYKLVETKAPAGYVLKDGAFYFWVRTDKNQTQPNQCPSDFSGSIVEVGGTLLAANDKAESTDETTSLSVQKIWKASDGTELTDITVESITVSIYQCTDGDTENKTLYQTLTLSKDNKWMAAVENLPLTGTGSDGSTVSYTYTVEEVAVDGYEAAYETQEGVVTITNTKKEVSGEEYVLPETGGPGTTLYTIGGLLLIAGADALLLYNHTKRRKEDSASS